MLKPCPQSTEVADLQFKLKCRFKVFDNKELDTFPKPYSLISCASRYGLLFVGTNTCLQVIQLKCIEDYTPKDKDISNYPRRIISLPSRPIHVSVNCDGTILAVVTDKDNCPFVIFYNVLTFFMPNVEVIKEIRLSSTPGTYVTEVNWNPALSAIFTACKSDGTLGVYEIKENSIDINELPSAAEAKTFCWSPKGKQIAVGSKNGKITQYKPDLKAVKVINEPPLGEPYFLISLQWVSNYQFIGIYQSSQPEGMARLIVIDAPKTGETAFTDYEDVCYSGSYRLPQFYMILQQHWNILMVASSNSTELGVLGANGDNWTQWIISDSARAELPLSSDHQETFPVGLALDISSTKPLPWNESVLPPCPYLLVLSHQGVLCVFHVINLKQGVPSICTPPDPISDSNEFQQFVTISDTGSALQLSSVPPKMEVPKLPTTFSLTQSTPSTQIPPLEIKTVTQPQPAVSVPSSLFGTKSNEGLAASGAPTSSFEAKSNEALSFFKGQISLTPVKAQQPSSTAGSLFTNQPTLINKPQISSSTVPVSNKYSSIFSSLNAPATASITNQSIPIVISTPVITKSEPQKEQVIVQPKVVSSEQKLTITKPVESTTSVDVKLKGETDALLAQMVRDECLSLESELKALLHYGTTLRINVGTENETLNLISKLDSLQEFIKEIVDISTGENAEVHCLKQNLIQSWAWYEEAKSRYNCSKDETISLLLKSQPLDSATEKRQMDIKKMICYLESQLTQASKALDEHWDKFQDYAKKVHKTKMPTMEAIFQTMVRQNAILQKQSYVLKDITNRLKSKSRSSNAPPLLVSVDNTNNLEDNLNSLHIEEPQDIYQIQYDLVVRRKKNLSVSKTNKLRTLLKNREILHVTAVKPQLSSSLALQSPSSRSKQLISILGAQMSPVSKIPVAKNLEFVQSTPIRDITNVKPVDTPPNTPTQIGSKGFTFKKVEISSTTNLVTTANNFISLSKGRSVVSNFPQENIVHSTLPTHTISAFVPTTQITFGSSKPFNFSSGTVTTPTTKSTTINVPMTSTATFSFDSSSANLPKFDVPKTTISTTTIASTSKISTPTNSNNSQFNFGSSISITPISTVKVGSSTATTTSIFAANTGMKSVFTFGSANVSTKNVDTNTSASQKVESTIPSTTSTILPFTNLSQTSKSLFGTTNTNSIPAWTLGAVSNSEKSAFSAVTTNVTSASPITTTVTSVITTSSTAAKNEVSASIVSQPSTFIFSQNIRNVVADSSKTAPPIIGSFTSLGNSNLTSTISNTTTATTTISKPISILSVAATTTTSTTTQSIFAIPTTTSIAVSTSNSSIFGNLPATTKSSLFNTTMSQSASNSVSVFSKLPTTATSSANQSIFAMPLTTSSVTSATTSSVEVLNLMSTKPSLVSSVVSATPDSTISTTVSNFNEPQPSVAAVVQTTESSIPSTKPSIFGTTVPSQTSVFGANVPKTSQMSIITNTNTTTQTQILGIPSITTTTNSSIFGSIPAATQSSVFGANNLATTQNSVFGNTASVSQPSIFGVGTGMSTSQTSIFGTVSTASSKTQSIFGTATTSSTMTPSIFGTVSTPSSTTPSIFGTASTPSSTTPSIFGTVSAPSSTTPSIFGTVSTPSSTTPSIFGTVSTTSSTTPSIFGTVSTASSMTAPIFGAVSTVASTTPSIFGSATITGSSVFGTATEPSTTQSSIFSSTASAATTKSLIFGGVTSPPATQSIFGATTIPSTQTSLFRTPNTTSSPFSSPFGVATTSGISAPFGQSSSVFGSPKTTTTAPFGSNFGNSVFGSATTTAAVFGQPSTFGQQSTSVFGPTTTSTNIFGATTNSSTFGTPSTSANVFGSPASPSTSFSFAAAANNVGSGGSFGFGNLIVGTPATTSSNVFGGSSNFGQSTTPPANPFGRTEQKSSFSGGTVFGSPASTSNSIFSSNTSSGFGTNTQSGFGAPAFGSTFGQSTFGQSSFGNTSFGSPQPGAFSSGTGVGQTGFGSNSSFQKPSGFGGAPVFGGSPQPAFGAAPSFGGTPAFGAAPTFGSPNKIFGSNTTAGFGSAASGSPVFGSLANQNTVGFGNLAPQSTPTSTPFSGSSSFSSWR